MSYRRIIRLLSGLISIKLVSTGSIVYHHLQVTAKFEGTNRWREISVLKVVVLYGVAGAGS
jgi:hypothetical protein